jgi:UDP-glucose 4-epimerase
MAVRGRCLVTGATGYLGSALVPALLAADIPVRLLLRSAAHFEQYNTGAIECVAGDLTEDFPQDLCRDVDVVYHLAALAHTHASAAAYTDVNVTATRRLAEAARDAGARRFVFISSVKAALPEGRCGPYGASKAAAEQQLLAVARETALELVILRPALIYGGDVRGYLRWLSRWVDAGLPAPPEGGARAMIARDDLVSLLLRLRTASLQTPSTLTVADGERYTAARLHRAMAAARRKKIVLPSPPRPLWRIAASALDMARRRPRGETWERLQGREFVEASDLPGLTGFSPTLRFEDVAGEGR